MKYLITRALFTIFFCTFLHSNVLAAEWTLQNTDEKGNQSFYDWTSIKRSGHLVKIRTKTVWGADYAKFMPKQNSAGDMVHFDCQKQLMKILDSTGNPMGFDRAWRKPKPGTVIEELMAKVCQ